MYLPADACADIIHRRVGIAPRHGLYLFVPVRVLHPGRAGRHGGLLGGVGCGIAAGCILIGGHCVQAAQGLRTRHAVGGQFAGLLVSLDGSRGLVAEHTVRASLQVAQLNQLLLQGLNVRSGGAHLQRSAGGRSCCCSSCLLRSGGGFHVGRFGVPAVKHPLRLFARRTVSGQAVCLLESPHGFHSLRAVVSVRFSGQVSQLNQGFLQLSHVCTGIILAHRGPADRRGRCRGHFRRGCRDLSRLRCRRCSLFQGVVAEQYRVGCLSGHAVIVQAVRFLECFQGVHGALAHFSVDRALVIAQFLQPLLHQLHVVALIAVSQGNRGNRNSRRRAGGNHNRRGSGVLCAQGGTGHDQLPGCRVGCAVGGQAVLFLEGAYRSDRIGIICAGGRPLQIAQLNQLLLQFRYGRAFVSFFHGYFRHRAQGTDAGFCARGVLRLAGIQECLDIRVHNAGGRIIILLLEGNNGFFGARAELSVRLAVQESQFNQCFLQGRYLPALRTLLQDIVSAGVLFRTQRHNRGRRRSRFDLLDFLEHNVIRLHIAGVLLVLNLSPGTFHSVHRDLRVCRNFLQQRAPGGAACPQIHLHLRLRGIGIAADGFQRFLRCLF